MFYASIPIGLALLGLLLVVLSFRVSSLRNRHKVAIGDGDNPDLQRAVRAQANFVEYVPMCLLLILVGQGMAISGWIILIAMIALVVGRVAHALGLSARAGPSTGRLVGTLLTWLVLAGMSVVLLIYALARLV